MIKLFSEMRKIDRFTMNVQKDTTSEIVFLLTAAQLGSAREVLAELNQLIQLSGMPEDRFFFWATRQRQGGSILAAYWQKLCTRV